MSQADRNEAGWREDPDDADRVRWYDGSRLTEQSMSRATHLAQRQLNALNAIARDVSALRLVVIGLILLNLIIGVAVVVVAGSK